MRLPPFYDDIEDFAFSLIEAYTRTFDEYAVGVAYYKGVKQGRHLHDFVTLLTDHYGDIIEEKGLDKLDSDNDDILF
jgi:hypothetical protein